MTRKHHPLIAKIVSWDEIEKRYADLVLHGLHFHNMIRLIQHVKNNGVNKRLFAYTSMHKLVVTIYDPAEVNREALHIELNPHTMRWCFEYRPKPYEPVEMTRYCDDDELITRFSRYVEMLKW